MTVRYEVEVEIRPEDHYLSADVRIECSPRRPGVPLEFLLHRDLEVSALSGDLVLGCERRPGGHVFAPEAATWAAEVSDPPDGTPLSLRVLYEGRLCRPIPEEWHVNRITGPWVELGMYGPWFPWMPGVPFTYDARLSIGPPYGVTGTGEITRQGGRWALTSQRPVEDMVIMAAPDLRQLPRSLAGIGVCVHHTSATRPRVASAIADDCIDILRFLTGWLGEIGTRHGLAVVMAPRERGGGYARPGLIVMQTPSIKSGEERHGLVRMVAHELAHLWWAGAEVTTWEDWLNESFAEYCALRTVASGYPDKLTHLVETRRGPVQNLPPIRGLDRRHEKAHEVLYTKGSILLFDLEQLLGQESFSRLLRTRLERGIHSTAGFIVLLDEIAGPEAAAWLEARLDA